MIVGHQPFRVNRTARVLLSVPSAPFVADGTTQQFHKVQLANLGIFVIGRDDTCIDIP